MCNGNKHHSGTLKQHLEVKFIRKLPINLLKLVQVARVANNVLHIVQPLGNP